MSNNLDTARRHKPIYSRSKILFWINKLFKRNRILQPYLRRKYENNPWLGLGSFVVRENALELEVVEYICELIENSGFDIILKLVLDKYQIETVSENIRGGNWEGGLPQLFFVVYDPKPIILRKEILRQYPEMDNERLLFKQKFRLHINVYLEEKFGMAFDLNLIHAMDNAFHVWKCIETCFPEYIDEIKLKFNRKLYLQKKLVVIE